MMLYELAGGHHITVGQVLDHCMVSTIWTYQEFQNMALSSKSLKDDFEDFDMVLAGMGKWLIDSQYSS
jgi:hypothetical protein